MEFFDLKRLYLACLVLALVSACASTQKLLDSTAKPETQQGYVAAAFSGNGFGNAFGLIDPASEKEYLFPFFRNAGTLTAQEFPEEMQMIRIPPGTYELKYWVTYDALFKEVTTCEELTGSMRRTVTVKPGRAVFIGRYTAEYSQNLSGGYDQRSFRVGRRAYDREIVDQMLQRFFPQFPSAQVDLL